MRLSALATPSLLLDRGKLLGNVERMARHLEGHGVPLRLHAKTAKCPEVIALAREAGVRSLTVSTVREAELLTAHGYSDLLYAVGIAPGKLPRLAELRRGGTDLTVILDSREQVAALAAAAEALGVVFPALVEIDSDRHRGGLAPDDPELLAVAGALDEAHGTELRGVMTHAGGSYGCRTVDEIVAMGEQERRALVTAAATLRRAGLPCPTVSAGSTPTVTFARDLRGLTEVRAGVYLFQDLVMAGLGVCGVDDIALSVLTTVIGRQRDRDWLIVDAGWMALSRDPGLHDAGEAFGVVCDLDGRLLGDLVVSAVTQEHGVVTSLRGTPLDHACFPVGRLLRILPNHACATAAMHRCYHVLEMDGTTRLTWERCDGW